MDVRAFDFDLPPELIAQDPTAERTDARLLHLNWQNDRIGHARVADLPGFFQAGDVLVLNDTRVFPARLLGRRDPSGGAVECLLIGRRDRVAGMPEHASPTSVEPPGPRSAQAESHYWEALPHPGQKLRPGAHMVFDGPVTLYGEVLERRFYGRRLIRLWTKDGTSVDQAIDAIGHVPLPPYIKRGDRTMDRDRYQTVYARRRGSVAAPTAGLHVSRDLLDALRQRGVETVEITLHIGYGTFQPVRTDRVEDHRLEPECYEIQESTAERVNRALEEDRRVIAVGTTTTRTLEAVARQHAGRLVAGSGATDLFIYPGFEFRVVQGLLTNFHLPQSSLLMLVCAFAGQARVLAGYRAAVAERYRFYSYGDAMLIL